MSAPRSHRVLGRSVIAGALAGASLGVALLAVLGLTAVLGTTGPARPEPPVLILTIAAGAVVGAVGGSFVGGVTGVALTASRRAAVDRARRGIAAAVSAVGAGAVTWAILAWLQATPAPSAVIIVLVMTALGAGFGWVLTPWLLRDEG